MLQRRRLLKDMRNRTLGYPRMLQAGIKQTHVARQIGVPTFELTICLDQQRSSPISYI